MSLPKAIENLITELARFPGIGRRSAERMALDLVMGSPDRRNSLLDAIAGVSERISSCPRCGYFAEESRCPICSDPTRKQNLLCVLETPLDAVAFEKSASFRGLYHVLGGRISPLKGIGPEDLRIEGLQKRLEKEPIEEVILATSPNVEGDATAMYLADTIQGRDLSITRLGRGIPMGASLEYADEGTLRMALDARQRLTRGA